MSKSVLYMEDNEGTARLLEKRLARIGYTIEVVHNGETGLNRCKEQSYDVVIVDYDMPGLNGLQVIQRLSEHGVKSPVIVLTGTGNEQIAVEALKLGAVDYMVKDIDGVYFDLLPTTIEQALKNQQLIEEKEHAEEALRESEERFRLLFEKAPDPYFVANMEGYMLDGNRAVERLLGLAVEDLISKHFTEMPLFNMLQLEKVNEILAQMSNEDYTDPTELDVTRPDGEILTFDLRMIPIRMKGQPQILGIGHDVTWRIQTEKYMKAHIERLETLSRIDDELTRRLDIEYVQSMALDNMMSLSNSNAGSIAILDGSSILSVKSVGYPVKLDDFYLFDKPSIVARVARQREPEWIYDVASDPDYLTILEDTCSQITIPLISQERLLGILNLETNDASNFTNELFEFLKLIAARIAVAIDNAQLYAVKQAQFVELQHLYEQVSQLEQLKTDMIRLAAHDLRTPLASILTKTYVLRKSGEQLTEKQINQVDSIDYSVNQMQSLITDFLSVERIEETMRPDSELQIINLTTLVQNVYQSYKTQAEAKKLVYQLSKPEISLMVHGFEIELQQVVTNLIGNAIKYTPEGETITVSLQRQDTVVVFEVIDSGYGISDSDQQKLFQPFFRAKTDETQSIEGTGLGLYLVKKFIERNRGDLIFQSEYGKGSIFGFKLGGLG